MVIQVWFEFRNNLNCHSYPSSQLIYPRIPSQSANRTHSYHRLKHSRVCCKHIDMIALLQRQRVLKLSAKWHVSTLAPKDRWPKPEQPKILNMSTNRTQTAKPTSRQHHHTRQQRSALVSATLGSVCEEVAAIWLLESCSFGKSLITFLFNFKSTNFNQRLWVGQSQPKSSFWPGLCISAPSDPYDLNPGTLAVPNIAITNLQSVLQCGKVLDGRWKPVSEEGTFGKSSTGKFYNNYHSIPISILLELPLQKVPSSETGFSLSYRSLSHRKTDCRFVIAMLGTASVPVFRWCTSLGAEI